MATIIQKDLHRYGAKKGLSGFIKGLRVAPGFKYTFFLRKAAGCGKYSVAGLFYRLMLRRYSYKFGFQIPLSTVIGDGFYIGHFGTVVISANVIIGGNCNIAHGVTIIQTNAGPQKGSPVIGDQVWIGTNAVIQGKITIGNNVYIATNSYVTFDVPSNTFVSGNPATMVPQANPVEGYINYIMGAN